MKFNNLNKNLANILFKSSPIILSVGYFSFYSIKRYFSETHFLTSKNIIKKEILKIFLNEEVYRINPIPGKTYQAVENAFYSNNKYYSTNIHPLKYVGVYINRIIIDENIYDIFYNNKEIRIKYTDKTCYKEYFETNENESMNLLLFC